jgi:hypothetical protein
MLFKLYKNINFRKLSNITTEEILVGGVEEIMVSYLAGPMPDISWPFIISGIKYNFQPFCRILDKVASDKEASG